MLFTIFILGLAIYAYLRWTSYRRKQKNRSRGDIQELTTHISSIDVALDNDSVENQVSKMDFIRSRIWNIPVNFLELSHEVIGRGQFGSLVKGRINFQYLYHSMLRRILNDIKIQDLQDESFRIYFI